VGGKGVLIFFRGQFFFFGFSFVWLIGPGIFRGNCPVGNFKGRYAFVLFYYVPNQNKGFLSYLILLGNTRACLNTWVEKGYFFERAKNLKISNFVCQSYLRDFLTDNFP
jgi:hypothetical protein